MQISTRFRSPFLATLLFLAPAGQAAQATWVHFNAAQSTLVYSNDNFGNRLPDFSFAGYEGGGVAIPTNVPVKQTLSPIPGDNTAQIQNALNAVSALTPGTNGFRGEVLLNPGTYQIAGTLTITNSGIVLRGSGDNTNTGTVLLVTGTARNILTATGTGGFSQVGGTYDIVDNYVPLGATNFHISGSSPIVWGTNTTVAADSDIFTNGTLLYAYNWSGTNQAVNGVTFTGTTSANPGNVSLTGVGSNYRNYASTSPPFSTLSLAYQELLCGGEYNSGTATATLTLNSLTAGRVYAVQFWVSDPRGGGTIGRTETVTGSNEVVLAYNAPAATGGVGQYSIGMFTASGGSQSFTFTGSASTQINALLVSDVTATGYQPVNPPTNQPPSAFSVGETVVIQRPWTQPWINAIGMNLLSNPWQPGTGLQLERTITAVNGNQITVDDPLVNPIESYWVTGLVYQVTDPGRIQQVGLENLCAVGQISDYPSNILTGVFANFANLKNSWMRNLLLMGWGNGLTLGGGSKWCTVQDCFYTNPATGTSSAAPAAWTIAGANCLFQRCVSDGGYYHIMVTQASTPGPNVFLNFNCTGTHYNGGPHQRWAAGVLHDNIIMAADSQGGYTPYLAINNRGNDGSGQGWAAGFSLAYNCQAPQFQIEEPATTTNEYNWAIGGVGSKDNYSDIGIYDAFGGIVSPHSLYLEQLKERLGGAAVENLGYTLFTITNSPSSQTVTAGSNTTFTVTVGDSTLMSNVVALSVSGLPANASASFNTNTIIGAGSATLTVVASNLIAPGTYTLNIVGASAGQMHSAAASLVVQNPSRTPVMNSLAVSRYNLIIAGTNGTGGGGYYVLTTTNAALPLNLWQRIATNQFDAGGNFRFTNSPGINAPQTFYLLELQ